MTKCKRKPGLDQRLMRWSLFIQDLYLDICYKKGKDNVLDLLISFKINKKLILCGSRFLYLFVT